MEINELNRKLEKIRIKGDVEKENISVVIGVRNRLDYRLENALKSIRNQDYFQDMIEIILVDYGSDISFVEKFKKLCNRFDADYIRVDNVNVWNRSHALNIGIKKCNTKYVLCSDVDIIFEKNYFYECLKELQRDSMQIVWRDMLDLFERDISEGFDVVKGYDFLKKKSVLRAKIEKSNYSFGLGIIFTLKKHFFEIRGYDEYYTYWGCEDDDIAKRFKMCGLKFKNISDRASYLHQWHPKYEGLDEKKENIIKRNRNYFKRINSVLRNESGWGIVPGKVDDLAVVCCYFNPCHFKKRFENYRIFRKGILNAGVKLLTVELAFGDDEFELKGFSDVVGLRTSKENVMWQKESLLNIGIKKLVDEGYEKIAWLDADIVFEDDWVKKLSEKLDRFNFVQVYGNVERDDEIGECRLIEGCVKYFKRFGKISGSKASTGFGWAVRADVLRKINLYDKGILGGGDALIFFASFYGSEYWKNILKKETVFKNLSFGLIRDYEKWAEKWKREVNGKISFVDCRIKALYHGRIVNRNYFKRGEILGKYGFNPQEDLEIGREGCLVWNGDKKDLHREVRDYFYNRKEDEDFGVSCEDFSEFDSISSRIEVLKKVLVSKSV